MPRLEGAAKVTGRAEYVHNLRLPGMLIGKIFRSTVAHGRIKSLDVERGARAPRRLSRRHHRRHPKTVIPNPFYGPAFHDQPILAVGKVHYVGEPVAVVLAHRSARRRGGGAADRGRVRGAAGGVRRGRGDDLEGDRARRAQARRHLPRPQASQGQEEHQRRARLPSAARRRREGVRRGRSRVRAHVPHPAGAARAARAVRLGRRSRPRPGSPSTPRRSRRRSCASRSRGCSAGRRTRCG